MRVSRSGDSRLRLVQVVLDLEPGGTQRLVIEMSRRLRSVVELLVCCLDRPGEWARELTDLDIPVIALSRKPGFQIRTAIELARLTRLHQSEVLHCHHYTPFVYGQLATMMRPGLRLVYTEHGLLSDAPLPWKRRLAQAVFGRLPGRFFSVSHHLHCQMVATGFPARRLNVIHNGIDPGPEPGRVDRVEARRRLRLPAEAMIVGTVARLEPVKDLFTLLDAFAALAPERRDVRLVIVGDGPERHRLEQHVERRGDSQRVLFTGLREDVLRLLPGFDLFVNSSITEGISVTILEAMSVALPIVATRVGGNSEIVIHGETGLLVPAREPRALAEAVETLANDTEQRRILGQSGRRRIIEHFSIDRMVASYLAAYRNAARDTESAAFR